MYNHENDYAFEQHEIQVFHAVSVCNPIVRNKLMQ